VVQELMGVHDLVVAGSHGFDMWSLEQGTIEPDAASGFEDLLARVTARRLMDEPPDELKVTPGEMVYEIQPKLDWDKGRAVLHLLTALGLDTDGVARGRP
jgi:trehalose 6-phosphate phosphatase